MRPPPLTPAAWLRFDAIRRGLQRANPTRVLEVGAGEGALGWRLARRFEYEGLEPDSRAFAVAKRRLARLGQGRIEKTTTGDFDGRAPYDLVCGFEVLEHVEHHAEELRRWCALLRPAGYVLLSVPAHSRRYGPADRAVGHWRRYDREDLEELIAEAGMELLTVEVWGAGLGHVLEWVRHRMAGRLTEEADPGPDGDRSPAEDGTARSGRWLQPRGRLAGLAAAIVAAPFRLLQHPLRRGRVGIGWVALARRID